MEKKYKIRNRMLDRAWDKILNIKKYSEQLREQKYFYITSSELKEITGQETRKLVKIDSYVDLPNIFKELKLGILPLSNATYIVGHIEMFHKLEDTSMLPVKELHFPSYINTLPYKNPSSESILLNTAVISGVPEDLFPDNEFHLTLSGRKYSKKFNYSVLGNHPNKDRFDINVQSTQIEVDSGFESKDNLLLIETKNGLPKDFVVRQLYYPYRQWSDILTKNIHPIFHTYCKKEKIHTFYIYKFNDENDYNSIELVRAKKYRIV